MSAPIDGIPRRVIPRWRDFRTAAALGEFTPHKSIVPVQILPADLAPLIHLWKSDPTEIVAGELLSAAWLANRLDVAREAAQFLLRATSSATNLTKEFARSILEGTKNPTEALNSPEGVDANTARSIRRALRLYPRNAIGWCELARYFTIVGEQERAKRAILVALRLAPENRFILRSAARCFVHLGDAESAFDILNRADGTRYDPWLLAASVSVANILEKPPRYFKRAKDLSKAASLSPFNKAELHAALGTLELFAGKDKEARRMLTLSLTAPNENVLAQAWWARTKVNLHIEPKLLDQPRSYEANTRALVQTDQWEGAASAAAQWLADEPFSSSPAIQLSFILNVAFGEHASAEVVLKRAFLANPNDLLVQNNLAFALASQGKTQEAEVVVANADLTSAAVGRVVALTATKGLICFRKGEIAEGRLLYDEAMRIAKQAQLIREQALAAAYLAKEERKAQTVEAEDAVALAEKLGESFNDPLFKLVLKTLREGPLPRNQAGMKVEPQSSTPIVL